MVADTKIAVFTFILTTAYSVKKSNSNAFNFKTASISRRVMNWSSTACCNICIQLEVFEIQYGFYICFFHDLDHSFTQNHFPKKLFQTLSHQLLCAALTVRVTISASLTAPSAFTATTLYSVVSSGVKLTVKT